MVFLRHKGFLPKSIIFFNSFSAQKLLGLIIRFKICKKIFLTWFKIEYIFYSGFSSQAFVPLLKLAEKYCHQFSLTTKHALLYLSRHKASSIAAFLAIAQGVLLLTLIPQVRSGLQDELNDVDGVKIPSLFLFDIQEIN